MAGRTFTHADFAVHTALIARVAALWAAESISAPEHPPDPKWFGNPWAGEKDGKQWVRHGDDELMRK